MVSGGRHEFTLVLDRAPVDDEYDALFEAGLDDTGFETAGGGAYAHVIRVADTLADAVLSAVRQLEQVGFTVVAVETEDLVTLKDIAARVNRTYESVRRLATGARGPGGFPPPFSASGWSLYSWTQVAEWFSNASLARIDVVDFDRQMALANYLVRARAMLHHHDTDRDLVKLVED